MKKIYVAPMCDIVTLSENLFILSGSGLQENEVSLYYSSNEGDLGNDESSNTEGWFGD